MRTSIICAAALASAVVAPFSAPADSLDDRLNRLDAEISRQSETIREQQKTIEELKTALDRKGAPNDSGAKLSGLFGGSLLNNPYLSVIVDAKAYGSNLDDNQRASRGIPGFTTQGSELRNGFNVDAAELAVFAPVDPYFNLYGNIPVTDEGATLEEAYFVTTALPEGFQIKGGRFKSNTSRLNAQHPHAWDFADLPLPYRAFLGPEGIGGENGVQLTWMPASPIYTLLGVEALQGDNPLLFGDNGSWGPHAYAVFGRLSVDPTDDSTLYLGPWAMFGRTDSTQIVDGFEMRGDSQLYGVEAVWKWNAGLQRLTLQGEYLYLVQSGDLIDLAATLPDQSLRRHQDGACLQAVYGYGRWGFGARYDRLELLSDTFRLDGVRQTSGGKPWRLTGSAEYSFSEFSRIRAQFSHDDSDPGGKVNNEGILQLTFSIGAHGAHTF